MTQVAQPETDETGGSDTPPQQPAGDGQKKPFFILYLNGEEYFAELRQLAFWVEHLLIPVYGKEVTSSAPWCPRWREHPEAIAQLHGLWLAWQSLTGPNAEVTGPAQWHRDYLGMIMDALRNPSGPFAGCKPGSHREVARPPVADDGFLDP